MARRIAQARATARIGAAIKRERTIASGAPGRCDEAQTGPAYRAEPMILCDRVAAPGAARRQGGVDDMA